MPSSHPSRLPAAKSVKLVPDLWNQVLTFWSNQIIGFAFLAMSPPPRRNQEALGMAAGFRVGASWPMAAGRFWNPSIHNVAALTMAN